MATSKAKRRGAAAAGAGAAVPAQAQGVPAGAGRYFYAGAAAVFLFALVVYLRTMARSAPFWDAGEFIASSYILGIPHSPGTPLYILLGRVFTILPLPLSIAGRVNLISVVSGALGAVFAYVLIVKFLDAIAGRSGTLTESVLKIGGALAGTLFLVFSDTYWGNATEAEVYALSSFLMGFMTWLGLKWSENPGSPKSTPLIYLLFYLLALSVGFHLGTILAFSGIFILVLMTKQKPFSNLEFIVAATGIAIFVADATLWRNGLLTSALLLGFAGVVIALSLAKSPFSAICSVLFFLGISVHLYLLIRSGLNPAIDEGDPETWRGLYAALRREQYPPTTLNTIMFGRKASFGFQLEHFNRYFQGQFEMLSAYWGKLNAGSIIPLGLGIWGVVDHYTRHKKSFVMLFVTFLVTSLGLIIYLNFSSSEVRERDYFYSPAFYYFAVFIGIGAGSVLLEWYKLLKRKAVTSAAATVAPAVFLLALPMFTLRHHYFSHDRSNNFICREYAKNMLVGLPENAMLFTNGDNDTFPLWFIQEVEGYRTDIRVINLSLLNTPWYIKQLRDNEPKVPIKWSDKQINMLQPLPTRDGWVLVRDQAIRHILKETKWTKPIYFAVTIPPEIFAPYRDYLEMEGLAYRVVSKSGRNMVNVDLVEENIWNRFSYLGILDENFRRDDTVYRKPFVRRLIQNYAAAFTQLAFIKYQEGDNAGAVKNLEVAGEISPDLDAVMLWMGWYYLEAGDTTKAIEFYKGEVERRPDRPEILYRLAGVYERIGRLDLALDTLEELLRRDPYHRDGMQSAVAIAVRLTLPMRARRIMTEWLANNPNDQSVRKLLEDLGKERFPTEGAEPGEE